MLLLCYRHRLWQIRCAWHIPSLLEIPVTECFLCWYTEMQLSVEISKREANNVQQNASSFYWQNDRGARTLLWIKDAQAWSFLSMSIWVCTTAAVALLFMLFCEKFTYMGNQILSDKPWMSFLDPSLYSAANSFLKCSRLSERYSDSLPVLLRTHTYKHGCAQAVMKLTTTKIWFSYKGQGREIYDAHNLRLKHVWKVSGPISHLSLSSLKVSKGLNTCSNNNNNKKREKSPCKRSFLKVQWMRKCILHMQVLYL